MGSLKLTFFAVNYFGVPVGVMALAKAEAASN